MIMIINYKYDMKWNTEQFNNSTEQLIGIEINQAPFNQSEI